MIQLFRGIQGLETDPLWGPTNVLRYAPANSLNEKLWINLDEVYARISTDPVYPGSVNSVGLTMPTGFTVGNSPVTETGILAVTNAFTTGSVVFAMGSGFAQDNANFFWDDSNNRLGLGTSSPQQQFHITKNMRFTTTSSDSTQGIFYRDTTRFLHTYGSNNIFFGLGAGNLTLSGGFGSNIGIGTNTLVLLTSGQFNIVMGTNNGQSITTGSSNTLIGLQAGRYITGSYNTALGDGALYGVLGSNVGSNNVAIGRNIGALVTTAANNTIVGTEAGEGLTTGSNNVFIGYRVGNETNVTGSSNIIIGYDIDLPTISTSNYLSIGNTIYGTITTGQVSIGVGTQVASAAFQVDSTIRGLLPPRMTQAQRDAISSPTAGLVIYNLTANKLNIYTTTWETITSS